MTNVGRRDSIARQHQGRAHLTISGFRERIEIPAGGICSNALSARVLDGELRIVGERRLVKLDGLEVRSVRGAWWYAARFQRVGNELFGGAVAFVADRAAGKAVAGKRFHYR